MIVYIYLPELNPDGAYLSGVPLRDLDESDLAPLPAYLVASIAALPFYRPAGGDAPASPTEEPTDG